MDGSEFKIFLREKPELMRAIVAFNGLAAPPAAAEMGLAAEDGLWRAVAERPELWPLWPRPPWPDFWDFQVERRRLALLGPEVVRSLSRRWGAALMAPRLATVVRAEEVIALRLSLGRELYDYALSRGRYHLGGLRDKLGGGNLAFSLEGAEAEGRRALAVCRHDWPDELNLEWIRRFDETRLPAVSPEPDLVRPLWFWLKKILLTEVAPQWWPCFE